jgi:hypothetical protein
MTPFDRWCAEAIRKDGLLTDSEAIFRSRYGDERWAQKAQPTRNPISRCPWRVAARP